MTRLTYHCHTCGGDNRFVNECGCDPSNMPTRPKNKEKNNA